MDNHGKVFTISNASQLETRSIVPKRVEILDRKDVDRTKTDIDSKAPLLFLANDVEQSISKNKYELILHGITSCGSKTTVIISGILPYIDVRIENAKNIAQESTAMQARLQNLDIEFIKIEQMRGQDFMHYYHKKRMYLRIYFETLKNRLSCIDAFRDCGIKTFSNDRSTYYRVVARDYEINLSGWNLLDNYHESNKGNFKSRFVLSMKINGIHSYSPEEQATELCPLHVLKYEKMILASFDIEMIPADLNRFPDADVCINDSIFMICITFHFAKKKETLLSICLTLKENDPLDDVITVVCKSESVLLLAFSKLFEMMQPEFITEFNGGGFDWRNIIKKVESYGIIGQFLQNMSLRQLEFWETKPTMLGRYFSDKLIKIGGASAPSRCRTLKMSGYVNFDTLVVFRQLEPNADSHKLNECLKRCNLGGKDDLDVKEMFRIYREGTATEMKLVAHYCFIDTCKLQSLLLKKNVIQDRREISVLSFTSIYDSFYYANGSKVRNLLMNVGAKRGYKFDTLYKPVIEDPEAKFPGAFVVPPIKGIVKPNMRFDEFLARQEIQFDKTMLDEGYQFIEEHFEDIINHTLDRSISMPDAAREYICYMLDTDNQYPVSGLDYSSLYPSIIMTYNISPETLITDESYANYLIEHGHKLHYVSFEFLNREFRAWFKQHSNDSCLYGLCPSILIELFAKRANLKKIMEPYKNKMTKMELEMKTYSDADRYPHLKEYNEVCFDFGYYDAKQKALKVFMNTYYGEMGNFVSFICAVETAASVTTLGKYNLMLAKAYVEDNLHMKAYYGDSVIGDTPIMIRRNGHKELIPIEELDNRYEMYNGRKECIDYSNEDVYVMTEAGYSKILKVIRHRTNKRLFRITTHIGSVIVTEDHSLLDSQKKKITPQDCKIGTKLLHWNPPVSEINDLLAGIDIEDIPNDIAFVKGFFFRDGGWLKHSFAIHNTSILLLQKCIEIFNSQYSDVKLKILDTSKSSGVYKAVAIGNVAKLVDEWRDQFYSSRKYKKVPNVIITGSRCTKLAFMQGYYAAGGDKKFKRISNKGQIGSQGLYLLLLDLGYDVSTFIRDDNLQIYTLTFTKDKQQCKFPNMIRHIEELGECNDYVYDLETESHHFAAGVGRMVVHNTDSLYLACNKVHFIDIDREYFTGRLDKIEYGTQLVEKTFKLIEIAKEEVNAYLAKDNGSNFLQMAYEEVLYPAVFLSKKKYMGIPHEEKINFYPKKPFLRGLEVVKRGTSDVLKNICMKVIWEILDIKCNYTMLELIAIAIKRFFTTQWDVDHFIKTAVYRLDKQNISVRRLVERYESEQYKIIPEPNVRFKYVICKKYPWTYNERGNQIILSIGDKMELVERAIEENIQIDLEYYFNNEITGQMARLIAYEDQFNDLDHDSLDSNLTEKERYKKIEEGLFKNAKKYIAELAKTYSNPYINKNKLFKQTYRTVASAIRIKDKRTHKIRSIHPPNVRRVVHILSGCDIDTSKEYLKTKIEKYIDYQYLIQADIRLPDIDQLYSYIAQNNLNRFLKDCSDEWISNIVRFIRSEYDYDVICEMSLEIEQVEDLFTKAELMEIVQKGELYVGLSTQQASKIIELLAEIVAIYV